MNRVLGPVSRQSLADGLAERVLEVIRGGGFRSGDRLPSIAHMAKRFGVGHPTLREALKKLETVGIVSIRHGSGVYVGKDTDALLISNPVFSGSVTSKLLVDLIEARIPIELTSVELAAKNATPEHLASMAELMERAEASLDDDVVLSSVNMAFHREIAAASGNTVLSQLLEVLTNLFHDEQRLILDIYGLRQQDHREHVQILEALERRDVELSVERMRTHLHGVRDVLLRAGSEDVPAS